MLDDIQPTLSRRTMIKSTAVAGGMVLSFSVPTGTATAKLTGLDVPGSEMDAWLAITADDRVIVTIDKTEMGQGAHTVGPMMVAEELDVAWDQVEVRMAPSLPVYAGPRGQGTGGSSGTTSSFDRLRQVGAVARQKLIGAAAAEWGTAPESLRTERGRIIAENGETITYGAVAEAAAAIEVAEDVTLKDPADWNILGTDMPRTDTPAKVDGTAVFGVDVQLPDLRVAAVKQCPVFGGTLVDCDETPALSVAGVEAVVKTDNAVVVVGSGYWPTTKGLELLEPKWDYGEHANASDATIGEALTAALETAKDPDVNLGDVDAGMSGAAASIDVTYEMPYLAHAPMEPMNATVRVDGDKAEAWVPTQMQTRTQRALASALDLPEENVIIYTTELGGAFGRRLTPDYVVQAGLASRAIGAPVKVIWSREEDTQHSTYRPRTIARMKGAVTETGAIAAWEAHVAEDSVLALFLQGPMAARLGEFASMGMIGKDYGVENARFTHHTVSSPFPVGAWRSVQASQNGFFAEAFTDELAHAAGADPLEFRLSISTNPRHIAALEKVKEMSNWGNVPDGHFQGVALVESFGAVIAQVVELSIADGTDITLHKISCVADCGTALHPSGVIAQAESSIIYGLTAAMFGEITMEEGRVQQANFDTYDMVRLNQTPDIETVIINSGAKLGGMGEPGLPPIAPALTNAIFAATGKRIRELPLSKAGYWLA